MSDEIWSVTFMYRLADDSFAQMEVFRKSMEDAQEAAMKIKEIIERSGMTFMWSQVAKMDDEAVTMEDNYYESVMIH